VVGDRLDARLDPEADRKTRRWRQGLLEDFCGLIASPRRWRGF
jgi:hypothetical protein